MHAAFYERTGPARDVLQWAEMPQPTPGPGEVRVRLRWSGLNPSDVKSRAGLRSSVLVFPRIVPHSDGMGVIDATGDGVASARLGERVWVWNAAWRRAFGTAAQYVVLPQAQAVVLPDATADEAGACLGIPALTALHAMLVGDGVAGRNVLVAAGAGAVGHYAVQFARLLGARRVVATVSNAQKAALAVAAGADAAVNYRSADAHEAIRQAVQGQDIDRVVEVDIAANAALDVELIGPGGECVVYGSGASQFQLPFFPLIVKNIALHFFIVYNLSESDRQRAVSTLSGWLERNQLSHQIGARFALADIAAAHEAVEQGAVTGNVVLEVP